MLAKRKSKAKAKKKTKKKAKKAKRKASYLIERDWEGEIIVGPGEGYLVAGLEPDETCDSGIELKRRLKAFWHMPCATLEVLRADPLVTMQDLMIIKLLNDVAVMGDFSKLMFVVDLLYGGGRVTGFDLGDDDDEGSKRALVQMVQLPVNGSENMEYVSLNEGAGDDE